MDQRDLRKAPHDHGQTPPWEARAIPGSQAALLQAHRPWSLALGRLVNDLAVLLWPLWYGASCAVQRSSYRTHVYTTITTILVIYMSRNVPQACRAKQSKQRSKVLRVTKKQQLDQSP